MWKDVPWSLIIDLLRFWGWVLIYLAVIKLLGLIVTEACGRWCRHCGKKV